MLAPPNGLAIVVGLPKANVGRVETGDIFVMRFDGTDVRRLTG